MFSDLIRANSRQTTALESAGPAKRTYLRLGDKEKVFDWLANAVEKHYAT
jgi:hypothetical protein